jgi:hypothetical protein
VQIRRDVQVQSPAGFALPTRLKHNREKSIAHLEHHLAVCNLFVYKKKSKHVYMYTRIVSNAREKT